MLNRLQGLRTFVAVIEEGTLARAAARLATSEPAASRQLAAFEDELGARLFARERRGLTATDEALRLYPEAERALAAVDDLPGAARRVRAGDRSPLRVIFQPRLTHSLVLPALAAFRARRPEARVRLEARLRVELERRFAAGEHHVGVGVLPVPEGRFRVERLCRAAPMLVVPAEHPLARRRAAAVDAPAPPPVLPPVDLPYVALFRRSPVRQRVDRAGDARGEVAEPGIEVSTADMAVRLVAAGAGYTIMDRLGIDDALLERVALLPWRDAEPLEFGAFLPADGAGHELAETFVACLRARCRTLAPDDGPGACGVPDAPPS